MNRVVKCTKVLQCKLLYCRFSALCYLEIAQLIVNQNRDIFFHVYYCC